ncbi:TetR/AcrR family transcriptional regulator [Amycolatopsis sp. YIM 10]|uniref:TetR/AcrR family transcriptional regulator n=1 Tax=Amycolatopsis sp. YIM 10 TaxID=2653857 RepID=UPI00128FDD9E|nr:TetR family transcriptional regulator C-terminal domain-containing protein [Amycolatopsis sp. YIM 10]QFU89305.1 transcriptional regulator BetI [Amycolatopsis sp. YIM 10]
MTPRAKRGPGDPGRRDRIVAAALAVVTRDGIAALSYRAVAREAAVPLGSTTYYFPQLDDLLAATVERAAADGLRDLEAWSDTVTSRDELVPRLAGLIHRQSTTGRARTVVAYELYSLGLRIPRYRELSTPWIGHLRTVLSRHCDPATADALTAAADGLQLQSLLRPEPFTEEQLIEVLRRTHQPR